MPPPTYYNERNPYEVRPTYGWEGNNSGSSGSGSIIIISGSSSDIQYLTVGESVNQGDFLYQGTDSRLYRASCASVQTTFAIGTALTTGSFNQLIPVDTRVGKISQNFSGLTPDVRYFLSESFGQITTQCPQNKGDSIYQIGIAQDSQSMLLLFQFFVLR